MIALTRASRLARKLPVRWASQMASRSAAGTSSQCGAHIGISPEMMRPQGVQGQFRNFFLGIRLLMVDCLWLMDGGGHLTPALSPERRGRIGFRHACIAGRGGWGEGYRR